MQKWYISQKLPFPDAVVDLLSDADEILYPLLKASGREIPVYKLQDMNSDNQMEISLWLGTE